VAFTPDSNHGDPNQGPGAEDDVEDEPYEVEALSDSDVEDAIDETPVNAIDQPTWAEWLHGPCTCPGCPSTPSNGGAGPSWANGIDGPATTGDECDVSPDGICLGCDDCVEEEEDCEVPPGEETWSKHGPPRRRGREPEWALTVEHREADETKRRKTSLSHPSLFSTMVYKYSDIPYDSSAGLGFLLTMFFTFVYFSGYASEWGHLRLLPVAAHWGVSSGLARSFRPGFRDLALWKRLLTLLIILTLFPYSQAAGCPHCHDQLEGCMGGDTCPFLATTAANVAALAAGATTAVLTVVQLLPREYLRVFTRQVLDTLQAVLRKPLPGNTPDIRGWSISALMTAFQNRIVPPAEVARELSTLVAGATPDEASLIKVALESISLTTRLETWTGTRGASASETQGFNQVMWALVGRVVDRSSKTVTINVDKDAGETGGMSKISERVTRPKTMADFSERISAFGAATHALGKYHILATTRFFRVVVYDTILRDNHPWQLAHELLMVYFEDLDNSTTLTLGNIIDSGALDARMARAKASMTEQYANIFREPKTPGPSADAGKKFNGRDTSSSSQYCLSFNLKNDHPRKHLNADGTCKHKHKCDQFVSEGGDANGRCGGDHPRKDCKHAHKVSKPPAGKE